MNMKTTIKSLFAIAAVLFAGSSMAAVISPTINGPDVCTYGGADPNCWQDDDGAPSQPSLADLAALVGIDPTDLETLYKDETDGNTPGEESGSFAGNYTTAWNPPDDEEEAFGATITWDGGSFISCPECYLWVKDGQSTPNLYVFDIGWWDGQETLTLQDFWLERGAISNIGIFGREGGDMQVPEPGTLGLLGIAALGLGLVRRRQV